MRHLLPLLFAAASFAQKPDDAIFKIRTFHQVAISPDGKRVAWSEKDHGIWKAIVDGTNRVQLTTGDDEGLAWSPDSAHLAYFAKKQLFVDGKVVAKLNGNPAEPRWSPDGKSIAFLFIENAKRAAGPLVAMSRAVGVIEEHIDEQRIAVVDVATKKLRIVTPAEMYVYHFDWSPDSKRMAAEAAPGRLKLDGTCTMLRRGYSVVTAGGVIGASVARDGRTAAVIHSGVHHPPEIWTGPIEDWKQLTHINNVNVSWGREKSIH